MPAAGRPIQAVIFDWGGTLTPWHQVDVPEQWRVYAREVHGIPVGSAEVGPLGLSELDPWTMAYRAPSRAALFRIWT